MEEVVIVVVAIAQYQFCLGVGSNARRRLNTPLQHIAVEGALFPKRCQRLATHILLVVVILHAAVAQPLLEF